MASGFSANMDVGKITRIFIAALLILIAVLAVSIMKERRQERAIRLENDMEKKLTNLVVEKPPELPEPESRDTKMLADRIGKEASRLWGPLIKPPPPPPPPPPKKPDLGKMAEGLVVKGIIGDPAGGGTVKFIVSGDGKPKIIGVGDKIRQFVIKGHSSRGLTLEFKGDTIALPVPGL